MAPSDFLDMNLAVQCDDLASEVNKTYRHLPWALKHEAVSRLKRQIHELSQRVQKAKDSSNAPATQKHLTEAISLTHECVPLLSLCLKKNLLSSELHDRWIKKLNGIEKHLSAWWRAAGGA